MVHIEGVGFDGAPDFRPVIGIGLLANRLQEPERSAFETDYRARVRSAYPAEADGHTLFPFRRLFIVAQRAGLAEAK